MEQKFLFHGYKIARKSDITAFVMDMSDDHMVKS
jgi:hypothetical protein